MAQSKEYRRIMLGQQSAFAEQAFRDGWIGVGYIFGVDLTGKFPDNWKNFNKEMIPVYLEQHPQKSKIAAGLACGMIHTICMGTQLGDIVLCPDGKGKYNVGEVIGNYYYVEGHGLPHQRKVKWLDCSITRSEMSEALQRSTGSASTVSNITKHSEEIELLISGHHIPKIIATDELIEDPSVFALEQHLEDFLVKNWSQTELGRSYDIYSEDGELVGQQFPSDTGPMDILAISKDRKELLIVELKKGRASDAVVGQIQRYMGYVQDELAEEGQTVRGVIIALEDDLRLSRALSVTTNIDFYRYQVSFKLIRGNV